MSYHALNEQQAIEYARLHSGLFSTDSTLECREIGDGNLNLVFHVSEPSTRKSVILKQALPYAKVVGESWPLTLDRARIESEALAYHNQRCPELVPALYAYDQELALTVMEDLSDHVIMRKGLIEGNQYPQFAEDISTFLANTLFFSSDLGMNQQAKKLQVQKFINVELCKITEDLIFEHPYYDAETNSISADLRPIVEQIWQDELLKAEVALLREQFLTKAEALLHGDLHTGSIFIKSDSTKVIDPEFAFYGPIGFDLGAVFGNLLLNYAGHEFWSDSAEQRHQHRAWLLQTIGSISELFEQKFIALWLEHGVDRMSKSVIYQEQYMTRLLQQSFGYAGCKMIRRVIGLAKVADIEQISHGDTKLRAQKLALAIGTTLVKHHRQFMSIDEVLASIEVLKG
jgi:5-methylthioribose kinase